MRIFLMEMLRQKYDRISSGFKIACFSNNW